MELFTSAAGLAYLARFLHVLVGIVWIGMLCYLTLVQAPFLGRAETPVRAAVLRGLALPALGWMRWSALASFLTGLAMFSIVGAGVTYDIAVGAVLGALMLLNAWLLVWPGQRALIEATARAEVGAGRDAIERGAARAHRAARTNLALVGPMLLLMGSSAHFSLGGPLVEASPASLAAVITSCILLEANALFGRLGPLASTGGAAVSSIVLAGLFWAFLVLL
jgi:uncharacterized membrane protein